MKNGKWKMKNWMALLLAGVFMTGCATAKTTTPVIGDGVIDLSTLGNGKIDIPQISPDAAAKLLPLLSLVATASGNQYAAQIIALLNSVTPAATGSTAAASSTGSVVTLNVDGSLNAPATLTQLYLKLSPEAQAQAVSVFVAYQNGQDVDPKQNMLLINEVSQIVKGESPSLGALCEWALNLYLASRENG